MSQQGADPTTRFTDRVEDYIRSRPGYPLAVLDALRSELDLRPEHTVADVGSGTGLLARVFLDHGHRVIGVEPNPAMAAAAEAWLGPSGLFRSVRARAEATGLATGSVDLVAAGQAFHWFSVPEARAEFRRILRPGGGVALVWNLRRLDSTPFLRDYEALVRRWSTDYAEVSERYAEEKSLRAFFSGPWREHRFDNTQAFDLEGLRRRLLSSSYTPREGDPRRDAMLADLPRLFSAHARQGRVAFDYDTRLFVGRLS